MANFGAWLKTVIVTQGMNIVWAIIILVVGWMAAKWLRGMAGRLMRKAKMDETLVTFLNNLIYIALLIFVGVAALNQMGFATTSIVAILGAAGLAVALSLQGSLANLAAGVIIIIMRPFKVGDVVEAAGIIGSVERLTILQTRMKTGDGRAVIVPNAKLVSDNVINYSANELRRIDLVVGVGYDDDLAKTKQVLEAVLKNDPRVLADPAYTVAVAELGASSVDFVVRPWVKTDDYWDARWAITEAIKHALDQAQINIPYPQQDIHLVSGWPESGKAQNG